MCKLDLATDLAYILSVSRTRSGIFEFRIKKEKKGKVSVSKDDVAMMADG